MTEDQAHVRASYLEFPVVGPGWQKKLVVPFLEAIKDRDDITILQIKEKFGGLRLYVAGPAWVQDLAEMLEEISTKVCEDCGKIDGWTYGNDEEPTAVTTIPGPTGWILSLCQRCRAAKESK